MLDLQKKLKMYENIPAELKAINRWLNWDLKKIPYSIKYTYRIDPTNIENLSSFDEATMNLEMNEDKYLGIGFSFNECDTIYGFDIDNCVHDGIISPEALKIVDIFRSYTEYSPSNKGLHIYFHSNLMLAGRKIEMEIYYSNLKMPYQMKAVEIYKCERYFTVTGNIYGEIKTLTKIDDELLQSLYDSLIKNCPKKEKATRDPSLPERKIVEMTDEEVLGKMFSSKKGEYLKQLYDGEQPMPELRPEQEKVDLTPSGYRSRLLTSFAWWTNNNSDQMKRLFESSALDKDPFHSSKLSAIRSGTDITFLDEQIQSAIDFNGDNGYTPPDPSALTASEIILARDGFPVPLPIHEIQYSTIDDETIEKALDGTILGEMVTIIRGRGEDKLNLQVALLKSLCMAGCAASGGISPAAGLNESPTKERGADLAKLKIHSLGLNIVTTNLCGLMVCPSGSGKDAFPTSWIMTKAGIHISTSGSKEGLLDAFLYKSSNVFCEINEFKRFFQKSNSGYEGQMLELIKELTTKYFYDQSKAVTKKDKETSRVVKYCAATVLAGIQPDIFKTFVNKERIDDGLLRRFLIAYMPRKTHRIKAWDTIDKNLLQKDSIRIIEILEHYKNLKGDFYPSDYKQYLDTICLNLLPDINAPFWEFTERILNISVPVFAILLQGGLTISPDIWERVEILAKLFNDNALYLLKDISIDEKTATVRGVKERLYDFIVLRSKDNVSCTKSDFSHAHVGGELAKERQQYIDELMLSGRIYLANKKDYRPVEIINDCKEKKNIKADIKPISQEIGQIILPKMESPELPKNIIQEAPKAPFEDGEIIFEE